MEAAARVTLDATGQPPLLPDEVMYRQQEAVDVYNRDKKSLRGGVSMVTSHRVCWMDKTRSDAIAWDFSSVVRVTEEEGGLIVGSAKIVIHLRLPRATVGAGGALRVPQGQPVPEDALAHVKLAFKHGGRDEFVAGLRKGLERRAQALAAPERPLAAAAPRADGGFSGFVQHREQQAESARAFATDAFRDLDSLAQHAQKLVQLAETYARAEQRAAEAKAGGRGGGAATPVAATPPSTGGTETPTPAAAPGAADVGSLVHNLGITSTLTRAECSSQKAFIEVVARSIASTLARPLEEAGGMMTLTDAYCLLNRARGTDLLSPADLRAAAELLGTSPLLKPLGIALRRFPSGLQVLQRADFSEDAAAGRIERLLLAREKAAAGAAFLTAIDLAAQWKAPLPIAQQLLLAAEGQGRVCRDDSIHGLRFFLNRFVSPTTTDLVSRRTIAAGSVPAAPPTVPAWLPAKTPEGMTYYYNPATGETAWSAP